VWRGWSTHKDRKCHAWRRHDRARMGRRARVEHGNGVISTMSDEKSNRGGSRRSRRRFFRPKKENPGQAPAPESSHPPEAKQNSTRQRKARRKAHSRQRPQEDVRAQAVEADVAYVTPKSVFIYTHSAHPEMRDSYEFRPDHFSSVGRHLDDYHHRHFVALCRGPRTRRRRRAACDQESAKTRLSTGTTGKKRNKCRHASADCDDPLFTRARRSRSDHPGLVLR
jgi:hypothetical protein